MKKLKNKKGFVLTYVLIAVLGIMLLASVFIMATVSNYKLGKLKNNRNESFYASEAIKEESLFEINEMTIKAENYARGIIDDENAEFRNSVEWKEFDKWINSSFSNSEDDLEKVNSLYNKAFDRQFETLYISYLLDQQPLQNYKLLKKNVLGEYKFVEDDEAESHSRFASNATLDDIFMNELSEIKFSPEDINPDNTVKSEVLNLNVDSEYMPEDNKIRLTLVTDSSAEIYDKQIEFIVDISTPEYEYTTETQTERKFAWTNDILENAVSANKNIVIADGTVTTNGDIYSLKDIHIGYRDELDPLGLSSSTEYHLKRAPNGVGRLNLQNGNLRTFSDIYVGYKDSDINIKKSKEDSSNAYTSDRNETGEVHAKSFIYSKNAKGSSVNVESDMFLYNNLEFLADDTSLYIGNDRSNVDGSLVTLFDGEWEIDEFSKNRNLTSAIYVDPSIDKLNIDILSYYISGVYYTDFKRSFDLNGRTKTAYYKTGESFTTMSQFPYYKYEFPTTLNYAYWGGTQSNLTSNISEYHNATKNTNLLEFWQTYNSRDEFANISELKAEQFWTWYNNLDNFPDSNVENPINQSNFMNVRKNIGSCYAKGMILANGSVIPPNGIYSGSGTEPTHTYNIDENTFNSDYRDKYVKQTDSEVVLLGIRNFQTNRVFNGNSSNSRTAHSRNLFSLINFANEYIDMDESGKLSVVTNKNVYINVPSSHRKANEYDTTIVNYNGSKDIEGVVATTGNIYVYNDGGIPLNFDGSLIAGGSIIFYGDGEKIINNYDSNVTSSNEGVNPSAREVINSKAIVYGSVMKNSNLVNAFHIDEGRRVVVDKYNNACYGWMPTDSFKFNLTTTIKDKNSNYSDNQIGPAMVDANVMSSTELKCVTRSSKYKGYELVSWREL